MNHWLFNTDEMEAAGKGKHEEMLRHQVIAAWGPCKGIGAEATLNKPDPGDIVYYFRAGVGIIARAVAADFLSLPSQLIFRQTREFIRPVNKLQILPVSKPITVREIRDEAGGQIPYRQIVGLIKSPAVVEYLSKRFSQISAKRPIKQHKPKTSGGGFHVDPELRKRVEKAASDFVKQWYEREGWLVKDVSRDKVGYDLHCTKSAQTKCVEVKGTSGLEQQFIITNNELEKSQSDPDFVLAIVTNALTKPTLTQYRGSELQDHFQFQAISLHASKLKN